MTRRNRDADVVIVGMGAAGGILGVANLLPEAAAGIYRCHRDGRHAEAGRIQERIGPLHNGVVAALGVPGVKAALDLLGAVGGAPRPPLAPPYAPAITRIRNLLVTAGVDTG